ncbi:ATP-binding protein [Meiothermus hypogaeus]|uniref:Transcriptional activator n=2 Tax=Meiothermus hypogaeus TaxID=884155 RepID=A0A511R5B6_9DEIN|nr:tetratricopeptide repeat protein [Meiothermus hypogaeus]RIH74938.1 putative HTH-type transcriptional regulator [Meiothermus hypogaeus]GEM84800.1 transcriptional activator [Meiothermus hypogaeus NBRC 106114]
MPQPALKLLLLGPPGLEQGGQLVHLATRKALGLLAYVAVERSGASRSQLAHLLWPENAEEQARASLRQELSRLGQILPQALQKPSQQLLRLDPARIQVDLWDFWDAIRTGQPGKALELYRGSFLQGLQLRETAAFEDWQAQIRQETLQHYLRCLLNLATAEEQAGRLREALTLWRQAIAADPLAERPYLEAMRLSEQLGDRAGALRLYQNMEQALADELGLAPGPEAQALARGLGQASSRPRLPVATTPLIGRDTEQLEVLQLLERPDCRLLNLVGPGGVGKTRLALAVAEQLESQNSSRTVCWVALQGRPLLSSLAEGLGLPLMGQGDLRAAVVHRLSEQPICLFLDEAEGLAVPAELEHLLRESPSTKLVLTSRERFRLRSEWIYEVKGLDYPEEDRLIQRSPAAELFRRCALRVEPHFRPNSEDWAAIAQICRLLSGLPLGLELAAALVRVMSCREIARSLEQDLRLLEGTLTELPARHSSLRGVLESSLAQLTPAKRQTLQALAVFEGSFSLPAAQAITNAALPALATLLDRALLQKTPEGYRILTVIRQHLLPHIPQAIHLAHARYFAGLLKAHEQGLRGGNQGEALLMFTQQYPNLKACWNWALANSYEELALEMIDGLFLLFELRGWFAEGEALMAQVATSPDRTLQSLALCRRGRFLHRLGDSAGAQQAIEQSLELGQGLIDEYETAFALNNLGLAAMSLGQPEKAKQLFSQSLEMRRRQKRPWGLGNALYNLGNLAVLQGDFEQAQRYLQEALEVYRGLSDLRGLSLALTGLGQAWTALGEYAVAREMFRQSLSFGVQLGDRFAESNAQLGLGTVAGIEYKNEECRERLQASLETAHQTGDQITIAKALLGLGRLTMRDAEYERALKLQRQALERFTQSHYPWGEALAYNHLGRTFFALGEVAEGKAYYRLALEQALRLGALPLALRAMAGLTTQLKPPLAQEVWRLVAHHKSADAWIREEIRRRAKRPLAPTPASLEEVAQRVLQAL